VSTRVARCSCGQVSATCTGEPVRISVCHCLACQRRTGSAFGVQARYDPARVQISGESRVWERRADDDGEGRTYRFCPECGATVYYTFENAPDIVVIPVGAFADPGFPAPSRFVYGERRHPWLTIAGEHEEEFP
jgi:hypothetical protein